MTQSAPGKKLGPFEEARRMRTTLAVGALVMTGLSAPVMAQTPNNGAPEVSVLRPSPNTLVYQAGPDGHFVVSGNANGAPVRSSIPARPLSC